MTKVIDSILSIDKFEQLYVVLKVMLQFPCLKDHMKTIGIYQSVINGASFEQKLLNNIKRYINMLVSGITNKNLKIFLRLLWFLLQKEWPMTVLFCLWHKMQSIDQVPGNNCVYSPTYLMLRIELLSVVLEIQNKNADTLNMDVVCGQIKQN